MNLIVTTMTFEIPKDVSLAPLVKDFGFSPPALDKPATKTYPMATGEEPVIVCVERDVRSADDYDNVHIDIWGDVSALPDVLTDLARAGLTS